ncbi:DUF2268 domain-containing protein [Paenisporosarcina sp. TG20]|uniref:DUF2268 domain-containing protein n=1 Tax=Paenisporosarcina sp. TG20 TaxID=1211706 RepID=UPI0002ED697F|nr:DUF2268 domain-containing protein [Paenisporosarcina sp. TG20]
MSVIRTDKWLLDLYDKPLEICEKIKAQFNGAQAPEIYNHLNLHGMYRPTKNGKKAVKRLQKNKVWEMVENERLHLQEMWGGPDVPVYIFPSDTKNLKLIQDFNGKSGLAYSDKLFLFISRDNAEKEIKALFTHEFNHVCRLSQHIKKEENYVLLDTIILEGLAENTVRERFGEKFIATWTSYYTEEELERMWITLVRPYRNKTWTDRKHHEIMYGLQSYPKMLGYCIGYYLVKKYMEENEVECKELLNIPTEQIAQIKRYR